MLEGTGKGGLVGGSAWSPQPGPRPRRGAGGRRPSGTAVLALLDAARAGSNLRIGWPANDGQHSPLGGRTGALRHENAHE
jgi:hypothetical protein